MKVKRIIKMIATGSGSQSVMAAITEREATLREIANQTVEHGLDSVQEKLDELRAFAISRLDHLRDVLADPKAIHQARALLAEQAGKFTSERVSEGGKISFKANGQIAFSGKRRLHARMVPKHRIVSRVHTLSAHYWRRDEFAAGVSKL